MTISILVVPSHHSGDELKTIELPTVAFDFPNPYTAIIRQKTGSDVDLAMIARGHETIASYLQGSYGIIVDRKADYTVHPVQAFQFHNAWVPLKAIAIVTHRTMSKTIAQIDKSLSKKPLEIFDNIEEAQQWIDKQLLGSGNCP